MVGCIHHWMCGEVTILEIDPLFFETHHELETGYEYQLCKKCGELRVNRLYTPPSEQREIHIPIDPEKHYKTSHTSLRGRPPVPPNYLSVSMVAQRLCLEENSVRIYLRASKLRGRMVESGDKKYWEVELSSVIEYEERQRAINVPAGRRREYNNVARSP